MTRWEDDWEVAECPQSQGQRLVRLSRAVPGSARYLEEVLERVRQASVRFDGSGEALVHATWKHYAEGVPTLGLWVALGADGHIIGHALGNVQDWCQRTVAWISQVVMDDCATPALRQTFMADTRKWVAEVNAWAKTHNPNWKEFNEVIMASPRMTKAWTRHTGYEEYRVLYRHIVR